MQHSSKPTLSFLTALWTLFIGGVLFSQISHQQNLGGTLHENSNWLLLSSILFGVGGSVLGGFQVSKIAYKTQTGKRLLIENALSLIGIVALHYYLVGPAMQRYSGVVYWVLEGLFIAFAILLSGRGIKRLHQEVPAARSLRGGSTLLLLALILGASGVFLLGLGSAMTGQSMGPLNAMLWLLSMISLVIGVMSAWKGSASLKKVEAPPVKAQMTPEEANTLLTYLSPDAPESSRESLLARARSVKIQKLWE